MKIQRNLVWSLPGYGRRRRNNDDDDDDDDGIQRYKRNEGGWQKVCCCCSNSVIAGFAVGLLICTAGIVPAVTIFLTNRGQTTSTSSTNTADSVSTGNPTSAVVTTTFVTTSTTTSTSTSTLTTTTTQTISSTTSSTSTTTTTTAPYCTTLITFDDIPNQLSTTGIVPNGYNNLNWTNTQYVNASTMPISGYQSAVTSPPFVAYNLGGSTIQITTANGTRFAFNSIVLAAAWRDNLVWTISGYRAGVNLLVGGMTLFAMNKTILTCGVCSNWDTFSMSSSGGTPRPGLSQNTTEFVFDNLCISFGY